MTIEKYYTLLWSIEAEPYELKKAKKLNMAEE